MKKAIAYILIVSTFLATSGFAQSAAQFQEMQDTMLRSDPIYQSTFRRCSVVRGSNSFEEALSAVWHSFSFQTMVGGLKQGLQVMTINPNAIAGLIVSRGLSPELYDTLQSPAFSLALQDCFGDNVALKRTYMAGLIASDVGPKAIEAGAIVYGYIAVGTILGGLMASLTKARPLLAVAIRTSLRVAGTGGAILAAVNAWRDMHEKPTAAQKKQFMAWISSPFTQSNRVSEEIENKLQSKIAMLNSQAAHASGLQRDDIIIKIVQLTGDYDQLMLDDVQTQQNLKELKIGS